MASTGEFQTEIDRLIQTDLRMNFISAIGKSEISVAERSFSFLDRVKMFVKPMPQPFLHGSRQLQDKVHKTQSLEDFKMASGIHDDMRSTATKLFKRQRLTRLVSKTGTGLRVGKQMVEALAQDHSG